MLSRLFLPLLQHRMAQKEPQQKRQRQKELTQVQKEKLLEKTRLEMRQNEKRSLRRAGDSCERCKSRWIYAFLFCNLNMHLLN